MINENLKVSIITVCMNSEETIERTINSVINQTYSNIEYIIVDGRSTDKTLKIINKYKDKISMLVSDNDKGIYDAMNKGIKLANGDVIYFLNAGDYLYDHTVISKISLEYGKDPVVDIIYGDVVMYDAEEKRLLKHEEISSEKHLFKYGICHQAIFSKKEVFSRSGLFDTNYKISADYDWICRTYLMNYIKFKHLNVIISNCLKGGVSDRYNLNEVKQNFLIKWNNFSLKTWIKCSPYILYNYSICVPYRLLEIDKLKKRFTG